MTATLGTVVARALLRMPRYGASLAEVALVDDTALAIPCCRHSPSATSLSSPPPARAATSGAGRPPPAARVPGGSPSRRCPTTTTRGDALRRARRPSAGRRRDRRRARRHPGPFPRSRSDAPHRTARDQLDALSGGQWWTNPADGATTQPAAPRVLAHRPLDALRRALRPGAERGHGAARRRRPGRPPPRRHPHRARPPRSAHHRRRDGLCGGRRHPRGSLGGGSARAAGTTRRRAHVVAPLALPDAVRGADGGERRARGCAARRRPRRCHAGRADPGARPGHPGRLLPCSLPAPTCWSRGWQGTLGSPVVVGHPDSTLPASVVLDALGTVQIGGGVGRAPRPRGAPSRPGRTPSLPPFSAAGHPVTGLATVATTKAMGV